VTAILEEAAANLIKSIKYWSHSKIRSKLSVCPRTRPISSVSAGFKSPPNDWPSSGP